MPLDTGGLSAAQPIPVFEYDEEKASSAYLAYIGLLAHERLDPTLADNADWRFLKQIAYGRFCIAFGVSE